MWFIMLLKRGYVVMVIGSLLVMISIYPLFLLIRENVLESSINARYNFEQVINVRNQSNRPSESEYSLSGPIQWQNNSLEVRTTDTGVDAPKSAFDRFEKEPKRIMTVSIVVNGEEVSVPTEAWLPVVITKDSDFLSWLNIIKIIDKKNKDERLAIVRRQAENWTRGDTQNQRWSILYLNEESEVTDEHFFYGDRSEHLLGVKLVQLSSQSSSPIGYKSDISYRMPSIIFPIVFPTGTCLIGVILLVLGFLVRKK
jgi:hypothetical protein